MSSPETFPFLLFALLLLAVVIVLFALQWYLIRNKARRYSLIIPCALFLLSLVGGGLMLALASVAAAVIVFICMSVPASFLLCMRVFINLK